MHTLSHSHPWNVGEWNYSLILIEKPEPIQGETVKEGDGLRAPESESLNTLVSETEYPGGGARQEHGRAMWGHLGAIGLRRL